MTVEETISPLVDIIVAQVMQGVKAEMKKLDIGGQCLKHDRSLSREEVTKKLGISAKTLNERVKLGTVPPPFTHGDEFPRWSENTIEKYMAGEWRSNNDKKICR